MKTGILMLAAGRAERFGSDKRLALMPDGRTLLDVTLANARASGLPLLVALADMPWASAGSFRAIAARLTRNCIVVPVCKGRRGHPVGFGGDFFADLAALGADEGARQLLTRYCDRVVELSLADVGIHRDIDLPVDLSQ